MDRLADCALEQTHIDVITPEGQTRTIALLTGGINGLLRYAACPKCLSAPENCREMKFVFLFSKFILRHLEVKG